VVAGLGHKVITVRAKSSRRSFWPLAAVLLAVGVATLGAAPSTAAPSCDRADCQKSVPSGSVQASGSSACVKPRRVQRLVFSKLKYAHIRRHFRAAVRRGWPRILVVNRPGADERRDRLLRDIPTKDGFDRDEYPPAVARGKGKGLERGRDPTGWKGDVRYVGSSENRSHGASLGGQLRKYCDGTQFRYVFR